MNKQNEQRTTMGDMCRSSAALCTVFWQCQANKLLWPLLLLLRGECQHAGG